MRTGAGILAVWPPVVALVVYWRMRRHDAWWRVLGAGALVSYALWICSVAFFPLPLASEAAVNSALWGRESGVNLVPFREMLSTMSHLGGWPLVRQFGGNLLLFVPFTLVAPVLWTRLRAWWWPLVVGLGGSLAIELVQLAVSAGLGYPYRKTDIDDVILNTTGAFLGYAVFVIGRMIGARRPASPGAAVGRTGSE